MSEAPTIAELMRRDPLELTDDNIDAIIEDLRKRRIMFNQGNQQAGKLATQKRKAATALKADGLDTKDFSIDDLLK